MKNGKSSERHSDLPSRSSRLEILKLFRGILIKSDAVHSIGVGEGQQTTIELAAREMERKREMEELAKKQGSEDSTKGCDGENMQESVPK
jgi:hypothetical protein